MGEIKTAVCGMYDSKRDELGMTNGWGRPVSTRLIQPCVTRLSQTGRVAGQLRPVPFRGGSTRVNPSRLNGTGQIRPVTNHGTNWVGKKFPRPFFFKSYIIIYVR